MNSFFQFAETTVGECKLSELAKEVPDKSLDYKELDKPITKVNESNENKGLSDEEKNKIKDEKGWSDEIINSIRNMDEYEKVYKDAGLVEAKINGKTCLVKEDLDLDYISYDKDGNPVTNRELMKAGKSPIDTKTGEKIELHHMGQDYNSPLVELTENSEHGGKNHGVLHDNKHESWRGDSILNKQYNNHDRPDHWKARNSEGGNN